MIMLAVALLMSMVLCLLFGVPYIDFLRKKTIGQYILDVAPEAHAKKSRHTDNRRCFYNRSNNHSVNYNSADGSANG